MKKFTLLALFLLSTSIFAETPAQPNRRDVDGLFRRTSLLEFSISEIEGSVREMQTQMTQVMAQSQEIEGMKSDLNELKRERAIIQSYRNLFSVDLSYVQNLMRLDQRMLEVKEAQSLTRLELNEDPYDQEDLNIFAASLEALIQCANTLRETLNVNLVDFVTRIYLSKEISHVKWDFRENEERGRWLLVNPDAHPDQCVNWIYTKYIR